VQTPRADGGERVPAPWRSPKRRPAMPRYYVPGCDKCGAPILNGDAPPGAEVVAVGTYEDLYRMCAKCGRETRERDQVRGEATPPWRLLIDGS
jgi:hypothetical protein